VYYTNIHSPVQNNTRSVPKVILNMNLYKFYLNSYQNYIVFDWEGIVQQYSVCLDNKAYHVVPKPRSGTTIPGTWIRVTVCSIFALVFLVLSIFIVNITKLSVYFELLVYCFKYLYYNLWMFSIKSSKRLMVLSSTCISNYYCKFYNSHRIVKWIYWIMYENFGCHTLK